MKRGFDVKSLALTALTLAVALILGVVETLVPPLLPALPFFRPGLSNVAVLFGAVVLGYFKTAVVAVAKSLLVPIFALNPVMIFYSLPSAFLSFTLAFFLVKLKKIGLPAVSFFAAILNNAVQLAVAALFTGSAAVFYYLPYLFLLGGASGVLTGALVTLVLKILPKKFLLR